MGGIRVTEYAEVADPERAYRDLVGRARDEYGSDPYSGTIATTEGWSQVRDEPLPVDAAKALAERGDLALEKWGACAAIPVADDAAFAWDTRFVRVPFDAASEEDAVRWGPRFDVLVDAIYDAAPESGGWQVARWEKALLPTGEPDVKVTVGKPTTTRVKGRRRTAYFIVPVAHGLSHSIDDLGEFRTEAEARKRLERAVEDNGVAMTVVGCRVADEPEGVVTEALVTCEPGEVRAVATYKVDLCRPKVSAPLGDLVVGWVFTGIAAC